jgi:hypothetical protein
MNSAAKMAARYTGQRLGAARRKTASVNPPGSHTEALSRGGKTKMALSAFIPQKAPKSRKARPHSSHGSTRALSRLESAIELSSEIKVCMRKI